MSLSADIVEKLHKWESIENSLAPLSSYQRNICLDLAEEISERPISKAIDRDIESEDNSTKDDFPIRTTNQFFKWYSKINQKWKETANFEYNTYLNTLKEKYETRTNLLSQTDNTMKQIDDLKTFCGEIFEKTNSVHESGEKLLAKKEYLINVCDEIDQRLGTFKKADNLFAKDVQSFFVNSDPFFEFLDDINECLEYFDVHNNYADSKYYAIQTRSVLNQALSSLQSYIITNLDTCKNSEESQAAENVADVDHISKYIQHYGQFNGVATKLTPLINQVEKRLEINEYEMLLADIQRHYVSLRISIMQPSLHAAVSKLVSSKMNDYCSLLRSLATMLIHTSQDEDKLYYKFFSKPSDVFAHYLESICFMMYDNMRPLVIHIKHLETLAEICSILRVEILQSRVSSNPKLEPFGKVTEQLLQDVQERLVFRAHIYFKSDISEFKPSSGDLAYPEMLEMIKSISEEIKMQEITSSCLSRSESRISLNSISSVGDSVRSSASRYIKQSANSSAGDLQGMWYPTVRRTLVCLSRLYRCVEKPIFQGLAQEAIACCTDSLTVASRTISNNKTEVDGYLFEIRHLLILREQIAPFQVDFTVKETTLDFQNLKTAAYNLLQNNNKIFSLNSTNALLEFILHGSPFIRENCLDSRKIVDKQLKQTCEDFIAHVTQRTVGSIQLFLGKVSNYLEMHKIKAEVTSVNVSDTLSKQEFADPHNVRDIIQDNVRKVKTFIPELQNIMSLYLGNVDTQFILFRPIKNNIVSVFAKVQSVINEYYATDDQLLIGCPNPEQISIQLSSASLSSRKVSLDKFSAGA